MWTGLILLLMYTRIRENINLKWKEFVLSNYSQECWIITLKADSKKKENYQRHKKGCP